MRDKMWTKVAFRGPGRHVCVTLAKPRVRGIT